MSNVGDKLLFDLTPTPEQQLMRETVRRFVQREMTAKQVRAADEAGQEPAGFYDHVLELGFGLVAIPEDLGGLGFARSPVGNTLLAEDLAYGDMALAIGSLASLSFTNAVLDQGSLELQSQVLPAFTGETSRFGALALQEPGLGSRPAQPQMRARRDGANYALSGVKCMVPLVDRAEWFLVSALCEDGSLGAFVVPSDADGVSLQRSAYMGLRPLALGEVSLTNVQVPAGYVLGTAEQPFALDRLLALSRIGLAAVTVGTCQALLDYVKDYCNDRVAFGEPITNRQSVAFMIADIAIELDGLRLLTYRAASRAEQGLPFVREAFLAKLQAGEKGMAMGSDGVQLLGGHGFIRDHMVELYYRNLRSIAVLEGALCV